MTKLKIVRGQHIEEAKAHRAGEFRRHPTPAEALLWEQLRANRLDSLHFRHQQVIDGFIVDFYCHAVGLVIELDGPIHQQTETYDAERDAIIAARGLRILRITNDELLTNPADVLDLIRQTCRDLLQNHT